MRIIAGRFKGKPISAGKDLSIRPVTTKIKESVFNILDDFIIDKEILDLFSGSGGFGLEALSRGAGKVTFVEKSFSSLQILQQNLTAFKIPDNQYTILKSDVSKFCAETQISSELILMDPPFNFATLQDLLNQICSRDILNVKGILVLHHEISNPILSETQLYQLMRQKNYGRNVVSFIMRKNENAA